MHVRLLIAACETSANNTHIFAADFSIPSAISRVQMLNNMLHSSEHSDRAQINRLLSDSVLLMEMTASGGPYQIQ